MAPSPALSIIAGAVRSGARRCPPSLVCDLRADGLPSRRRTDTLAIIVELVKPRFMSKVPMVYGTVISNAIVFGAIVFGAIVFVSLMLSRAVRPPPPPSAGWRTPASWTRRGASSLFSPLSRCIASCRMLLPIA